MTDLELLENLKKQQKEIQKKIKELTGSTHGNYIRNNCVCFGKPHKGKTYRNEPFEIRVTKLLCDEIQTEKWITIGHSRDLISIKTYISNLISSLKNVLNRLDGELERW